MQLYSMADVGGPSGTILCGLLAPLIISAGSATDGDAADHANPAMGWPYCFNYPALLGLVWCVVWNHYVSDGPENHPTISIQERSWILRQFELERSKETTEGGDVTAVPTWRSIPWLELLLSRPLWSMYLVNFGGNWLWYTLLIYLPKVRILEPAVSLPIYAHISNLARVWRVHPVATCAELHLNQQVPCQTVPRPGPGRRAPARSSSLSVSHASVAPAPIALAVHGRAARVRSVAGWLCVRIAVPLHDPWGIVRIQLGRPFDRVEAAVAAIGALHLHAGRGHRLVSMPVHHHPEVRVHDLSTPLHPPL